MNEHEHDHDDGEEQPCAMCGCLPSEPEEWTDGEGPWRLYRRCGCDCHEAAAAWDGETSVWA